MTGFTLSVPAGVEIEHAHEVTGWDESVDDSTATWNGGPLATGTELGFGMTLKADVEPGVVELQARAALRGRQRGLVAGGADRSRRRRRARRRTSRWPASSP